MKKLITLMLTLCCLTQLNAQELEDRRSVKSGNWNDASTWERYTAAGWVTPAAVQSNRNYTIHQNHVVTLTAGANCKNLTVEAGSTLKSDKDEGDGTQFLRFGNTVSTEVSIVQNNGLIGGTENGTGGGLILEVAASSKGGKLTGSGTCRVARLRILQGNILSPTLEVDQNVTVTDAVGPFTAYTGSSASVFEEDNTITINAGKMVKIANPLGAFHMGSDATTQKAGKYTYNINGTLDLSTSTVASHVFPFSNNSSSIVTVNVSGLLQLGTGLNLLNSSPSVNTNGNVVVNVKNGGVIDATKTTTLTTGDNYFKLAGSGTVKRSVGNIDVSFPVGLQSASSANPIILNNSGTETNFSVKLQGTFDAEPVSTQVVNRQWNITPDDAGANVNIKLQWKSGEHGLGFNALQSVSLTKLNADVWTPSGVASLTLPDDLSDPSKIYLAEINNITSFGSFSLQNSSTLPLNFVSFDAKLVNKQFSPEVALNWTTQNEVNTENFVIERSLDGSNFVSIGSISSKNASGTHFYSFIDRSPIPNTSYYRLKQIDKDGKFDFSDIRSISNSFGIQFSVYPNPSTEKINILHPIADNKTLVKIIDLSGKLVGSYPVTAGNTNTTISVANLSSSLYFLYFEKQDLNFTSKFIKK